MSAEQTVKDSGLGNTMGEGEGQLDLLLTSGQRDWRDVFTDDSGQATVETLLIIGAVILPLATGAYFWVDITRHLFSRNAKYLALPFP
jgi:hypothetical protein